MLVANLVVIDVNLGKGIDVFNDENLFERLEEALMSKRYKDNMYQMLKDIMAKNPCQS